MIIIRKVHFIIITITILSFSDILKSAEIDGIYFKDEYTLSQEKLTIRGYSILNYMLVIKAYAGALYLKSDIPAEQALAETPRIIELYYFHKISAVDFRDSTAEMIKKNTNNAEFNKINPQLIEFNNLYVDVKPGDRYRAEFIPGKGTSLFYNGRFLGLIKGSDFSKAFFSIWIGRSPIDKKFRDILLGRRK